MPNSEDLATPHTIKWIMFYNIVTYGGLQGFSNFLKKFKLHRFNFTIEVNSDHMDKMSSLRRRMWNSNEHYN